MLWLVILVLYVCFICALANNHDSNRKMGKCQTDSNSVSRYVNRTATQNTLFPLRIQTEKKEQPLLQNENNTKNTKSWLFELGF